MKIKMMTMQLSRRLEMMTKKQIKKKEVMRNPRVQLLLLEMRHRETRPIEKVVMTMLLQQIKRLWRELRNWNSVLKSRKGACRQTCLVMISDLMTGSPKPSIKLSKMFDREGFRHLKQMLQLEVLLLLQQKQPKEIKRELCTRTTSWKYLVNNPSTAYSCVFNSGSTRLSGL